MKEIWETIRGEYKLMDFLGAGSFGQVLRAKKRRTGQIVAIKLIVNPFRDAYEARKMFREIKILTSLSKMQDNEFVTNLIDVIVPPHIEQQIPSVHLPEINLTSPRNLMSPQTSEKSLRFVGSPFTDTRTRTFKNSSRPNS